MNLERELAAYKILSYSKKTEQEKAIMDGATKQLFESGIEQRALQVGDTIPSLQLRDQFGTHLAVSNLLQQGPLVIVFYRGGWCPYCNLELRAYQEILPELQARHANLLAISPERMELGVDLTQKHRLTFPLLFDENLTVARQFGLVFSLPENLIELYERMGIDLVKSQGNDHGELPVPATYVVNSNGVIVYAFVQADYTKRLEPQVVLDVLSR